MIKLLMIGLGGFLGSISRYGIYMVLDKPLLASFPFATLSVNVLGSFLLGIIYGLSLHTSAIHPHLRFFLAVGFCGSFTTFSTFALDNMNLLQVSHPFSAIINIVLNVVLCTGAVFLGYYLSRS